jgi:hypothetical protein
VRWQDELNEKRREGGWYGCIAPDGWKDIILEADAMMAFIDPEYKINQVKEKFGTLRYYFETKKEGVEFSIMEAIADAVELKSTITCQNCGTYGKLRSERWYWKTLCNKCDERESGKGESND